MMDVFLVMMMLAVMMVFLMMVLAVMRMLLMMVFVVRMLMVLRQIHVEIGGLDSTLVHGAMHQRIFPQGKLGKLRFQIGKRHACVYQGA